MADLYVDKTDVFQFLENGQRMYVSNPVPDGYTPTDEPVLLSMVGFKSAPALDFNEPNPFSGEMTDMTGYVSEEGLNRFRRRGWQPPELGG